MLADCIRGGQLPHRRVLRLALLAVVLGSAAGCSRPGSSSGGPAGVPLSVARPGHLFQEMYYLTVDHHGNVYADDTMNFDETSGRNRILKFSPSGHVIAVLGRLPVGHRPGQFSAPNGVAVDSHDDLFVADEFNGRIQKFSPDGQVQPGWGAANQKSGQLSTPYGLTVDGRDNVYVAEYGANVISKFSPRGQLVARFPLPSNPFDVAVDSHGRIYVSLVHMGSIVALSTTGKTLATWVSNADGLAVDGKGDVYAAADGEGVQKLSPAGKVLRTWGPLASSDGRLAGMSALGVAVDSHGNVYVSDAAEGHKQVIKFAPSGTVLSIWR